MNKQTQFCEKIVSVVTENSWNHLMNSINTDNHVSNSKALFNAVPFKIPIVQLVLDAKQHLFGSKIPVCVGWLIYWVSF